MPISSLPSPHGIGTMGKAAYDFADFLAAAGQKYWQLLPLGPTSYGDSPYQSFSSFAGNPYFIDLDLLVKDKLLTRAEVNACDWGDDPRYVDYGKIYASRFTLLEKAKARGFTRDREAVAAFEQENERWLPNYALFMALKRHFGMKSWTEWDDEDIRCRTSSEVIERYRAELREDVELFTYIQFLFFRQWEALKAYIHSLGIRIIGDLPIYVAMDSADVWAEPEMFQLDEHNVPTEVSGVPPDCFSEDGQLWGNPLYNYDAMAKDGFGWWIRRIGGAQKLYDVIRIDHFRGFESYWAIPYGETTAKNGRWVKGPGMALVGVQYVISIGLIVAALFVGLQNRYLRRYPTGYDRNRVVVVSLTSGALERRDALVGALKSRAEIEEVAFAFQRFGAEENFSGWARPYRDRGDISFRVLVVTPEFLRVLGVRPSEGRDFSDADPLREQGTYIFNQTARRRWDMRPGDCISETRHVSGWGEIAGFLPDGFRAYSRHRAEDPFALFVPGTVGWTLPLSYCYIRIAPGADLSAAVEHIRRSLHSVTPLEPDIEFLDTAVDTLYRKDFRAGVLVSAFSALAIFVSLMGVFGLVLFETQHRRKEIGIRKVCGATSASVLRMFNLRFVRIVLVSFLVAAPLARYGVSVWLRGFVDAVPLSAWVFFAALAIVLAITVLTVTVRSWRTAGENPVDSVKTE